MFISCLYQCIIFDVYVFYICLYKFYINYNCDNNVKTFKTRISILNGCYSIPQMWGTRYLLPI